MCDNGSRHRINSIYVATEEDVESVTVVEFNKDVIDLFDRYIRPQFKTDKKLEIIHGNARLL